MRMDMRRAAQQWRAARVACLALTNQKTVPGLPRTGSCYSEVLRSLPRALCSEVAGSAKEIIGVAEAIPISSKRSHAPVQELPHLLQDLVCEHGSGQAERLSSASNLLLIGIDPDNSGAVTVLKLGDSQDDAVAALQEADIIVYDMPCISLPVGKRKRRQANARAIAEIVKKALEKAGSGGIHCILEEPLPGPLNGKQSVFGTGFAYGVWNGVLSSHSISLDTVSARRWKNDLALNGSGKEGSRAMAAALFPQAQELLRRKKDHGRAESMLILAWAVGLRIPKSSPTAAQLSRTDPSNSMDSQSSDQEDLEPSIAELEAHSSEQISPKGNRAVLLIAA